MSIAAGVAAFFAVSCAKEDTTLRYNNVTMGNIVNGTFISDQGNRFNIAEQTCAGNIADFNRALIICDVLNSTEAENVYDIRLNFMAGVLVKDMLPVSETEYANDPIIRSEFWVSGGYLNIGLSFPIKKTDAKKHEFNLLHEKKEGVYKFTLRHNAEGEIIKEEGGNNDLMQTFTYLSFPITSIITEDKAKIEIETTNYIIEGNYITNKSTASTIKMDYMKSGYEQAPLSAVPGTASYTLQ